MRWKGLNARQRLFCQLFVSMGGARGAAPKAYTQAGYKCSEASLLASPYRLLDCVRIRERIDELQAQKEARLDKKAITKENLVAKLWEIVHDPEAKRGESTQAGIAIAKMVGWNAPTRVEHDLGDRVRAYLEDIRTKPLRPMLQVVDVKRIAP